MQKKDHQALRRSALAVACAVVCGGAQADITTTGSVWTYPGPPVSIGPGNTDIGNAGLQVGSGVSGTLTVSAGSLLRAGALINAGGAPNITGDTLVTGSGSRIEIDGDPIANNWLNRLEVSAWGRGTLTVADGASIDTTLNTAVCQSTPYCSTFVGNFAGSDATFTLTGAGSNASILRTLYVGGVAVFAPPQASFTAGTPGGATTGRVQVLNGATLRTDYAQLGLAPGGTSYTGTERSFADAVVSGPGSLWRLTGSTIAADNAAASMSTANHRNAWATIDVNNGGELRVEGVAGKYNFISLTNGGGRTDVTVRDVGSKLAYVGDAGVLNIGASLGSASLSVLNGGQVGGMFYTAVGRNGSFGSLLIDGAGSFFAVDGTASAAANGATGAAVMDIGRNGGNGTVTVSNGGRLRLETTTATTNGPGFSLGRDAASAGTLNIASGGVVILSTDSVAPGSAGESWNPFTRIGRDGSGTLNISGGGKFIVEGNAVSTVANTRRTSVFIGGSGDSTIGGKGIATITGAGSELRVTGSDAYIGVGHGPQAVGTLTMSNQASASAIILAVGNFSGTGVAQLDNASITLSGQYTGNGEYGAAFVIGAGVGAVGNVNASNGSQIRITNALGSPSGFTLGGSRTLTGGDGTLTLNASSLSVDAPAGGGTVGRSGSGLLRMQNASTLDVNGGVLTIGRESGSDGTLIATGGSVINAGWVGVGRRQDGSGGSVDGGTATMVLNGATLNAQDVVIGTNGFLGGTTGSINVSGSVTNYGIFSPGSSPGTFTINGNYAAGAGSRLVLEVEEDGHGGFVTDEVHFGAGAAIDLGTTAVEFRFLGATNPNAFQASGRFDIDTFVRQVDAGGVLAGLADGKFAGVSFSAQSDAYTFTSFTFSAASGASFTAIPSAVPEPSAWLLAGAGLALVGWRARRRWASA